MRENILRLLDADTDLPPYPEILHRLELYLLNPDASMSEVVTIIESDSILAGRLLKIANSVFYAAGRSKINSLQLAVGRMGLQSVRELVYSITIPRIFESSETIGHHSFWRHSLVAAIFSRELARSLGQPASVQDRAYLTGLFHDTGIIVFSKLIPRKFKLFVEKNRNDPRSLFKLEEEEFGITHAEIGALYIQKQWEIDPLIADVIKYQPQVPEDNAEIGLFVRMLNLANVVCDELGITNGLGDHPETIDEKLWEYFGISEEQIDEIMSEVEKALEEAETLLFA
ncbi:MAG: HDOD domain-containing protein [FCB group bacterium]|nr:HDOD domain-containing protein [FCB group bacterium]